MKTITITLSIILGSYGFVVSDRDELEDNIRALKVRWNSAIIGSLQVELNINHCPIRWVRAGKE